MLKKIFLLLICFFSINVFAQNTLDTYLQFAIKNSPIFITNQNQINALTLDSNLLRAVLKPQVNFTSNDMYAPVVNGYGYDEIITNKGNYNALLGANYTVIGKNNFKNQYASLTIQKEFLKLNSKLNERDLKQTVTAQYITVYGEQQILLNTESVLNVLQKEDLILKNISQKGIYRQTDYLSFFVNYKQQQLAYTRQKLVTKNDLYFLNYLCGIADTTEIYLEAPPVNSPAMLKIEQAVGYKQYFLDSLQIQNSINQIKYHYKPKLNLLGDAGYYSSLIYHAQKNFGASIGLNFSVPIYNGKQRSFQYQKIKLLESTRTNRADYFKKQFNIKQLQLQRQIIDIEKLIIAAKEQLKASETLLKVNNQLLETGDAKIADYILALTNYISSQVTVQQFITGKMQLVNELTYLNY